MIEANVWRPPNLAGAGPRSTASRLVLPLHPSTILVSLDTVRAVSGLEADKVWTRVESGRLVWVWDISTHPHRRGAACAAELRELRFWAAELMAPEYCRSLQIEQVLSAMLGARRQRWRAVEVAQWLLCSRSMVKRLADAGNLAGPLEAGTRWITRSSLEDFLRRRLLS